GPRSVASPCSFTDGPYTSLCPTQGPSLCPSCARRCCSRASVPAQANAQASQGHFTWYASPGPMKRGNECRSGSSSGGGASGAHERSQRESIMLRNCAQLVAWDKAPHGPGHPDRHGTDLATVGPRGKPRGSKPPTGLQRGAAET